MASHSTLKRQKGNDGEEIITMLPEPLISNILSSLPTKDAVGTSVLSKRWIPLWRSITKLDFKDGAFYSRKENEIGGTQRFKSFVNRVLHLIESPSLDSFSHIHDESVVNTWISSVLSRNLKKLFIQLAMKLHVSDLTEHSLFNSQLLEELVMNMYSCAHIKFPTSNVHMGNLKVTQVSWNQILPLTPPMA